MLFKYLMNQDYVDYSDDILKAQQAYQKAVEHARFLSNSEKTDWITLGYHKSADELKEATKAILNKNMQALAMQHQLEQLKPNT